MRLAAVLPVLVLLVSVSLFIQTVPSTATSPSNADRHFGFWVSGNLIGKPFYPSPTVFADAMFLTPPYPSSAEFMMFGAYKDIQAGTSNPADGQFTASDLGELDGIASVADSYPNIEINVMVALGDLSSPLALKYFQYYTSNLAPYPSIYSIGLEGEYSSNVTVSNETPLMQAAQAAGKQYIDYYKNSGVGSIIGHTNWPDGDFEGLLGSFTGGSYVGISSGYDSNFPFPGICSLPSNPDDNNPSICGWTQAEVGAELQYAVQQPTANRQFVQFTAGADSSGSFTGVSGQTTTEMWDNPILRNWIWTDPNYQGNFVLSTSPVTSSTSTASSTRNSTSSESSTQTTQTTKSTSTTDTTSATFSSSVVSSSTISRTETSSEPVTSTSQGPYSLEVVGGCNSTGSGVYSPGSVVTVQTLGVCDRTNGTGTRVTDWALDGGQPSAVDSTGVISVPVLMNSSHVLTFGNATQFQLTFDYGASLALYSVTPPTVPGDLYWYDSGAQVTYSGYTSVGSEHFVAWRWDNGPTSLSGNGSLFQTTAISMDAPHMLHVVFTSEQTNSSAGSSMVFIESNAGSQALFVVDGKSYAGDVSFSWTAGSAHTVSAEPTPSTSSERMSFLSWSGMLNSSSSAVTVQATGIQTLVASYDTQYLVHIVFTDSVGNPLSPRNVTLSTGSASVPLPTNSTAWLDEGVHYWVSCAIWEGVDVGRYNPPVDFDSYGVVPVKLLVFPLTVVVRDPFSIPIQGAAVRLEGSEGLKMSALTNATGAVEFEVPIGLYSVAASYFEYTGTSSADSVGVQVVNLMLPLSPLSVSLTALAAGLPVGFLAVRRFRARRTTYELTVPYGGGS